MQAVKQPMSANATTFIYKSQGAFEIEITSRRAFDNMWFRNKNGTNEDYREKNKRRKTKDIKSFMHTSVKAIFEYTR